MLEYSFGADLAPRTVGQVTAPPKPPVDPVRWKPPPVDPLPDLPPADLTVIPVPGNAPEDVVVDADGNIWTGVDDGRIWVAIVSPVNAAAEWLAPRSPTLRKLMWKLPDRLQPQIKPEVWAVAFDPDTGKVVAGVHTEHPSFGTVSGVVEADGKLWMGCIGAPAVAYTQTP